MKRLVVMIVPTVFAALAAGLPARPALAQPAASPQTPASAPAPAVPIEVTTPGAVPPPRGFRLAPTMPFEEPGIREQEFYPGYEIRSRHEPAFIEPLVTRVRLSPTSGGRVGLSGWTAPAVPFDIPQATGEVAFGLTFSWGEPVDEKKEPAPDAPR